jgi:hypothetical protein
MYCNRKKINYYDSDSDYIYIYTHIHIVTCIATYCAINYRSIFSGIAVNNWLGVNLGSWEWYPPPPPAVEYN